MYKPGTSFEFEGETLHVVAAVERQGVPINERFCHGCVAYSVPNKCTPLRMNCGKINRGCVVFVRDIEQFRAEVVAWTLTGNSS
jgi:hypothetical protein